MENQPTLQRCLSFRFLVWVQAELYESALNFKCSDKQQSGTSRCYLIGSSLKLTEIDFCQRQFETVSLRGKCADGLLEAEEGWAQKHLQQRYCNELNNTS